MREKIVPVCGNIFWSLLALLVSDLGVIRHPYSSLGLGIVRKHGGKGPNIDLGNPYQLPTDKITPEKWSDKKITLKRRFHWKYIPLISLGTGGQVRGGGIFIMVPLAGVLNRTDLRLNLARIGLLRGLFVKTPSSMIVGPPN